MIYFFNKTKLSKHSLYAPTSVNVYKKEHWIEYIRDIWPIKDKIIGKQIFKAY